MILRLESWISNLKKRQGFACHCVPYIMSISGTFYFINMNLHQGIVSKGKIIVSVSRFFLGTTPRETAESCREFEQGSSTYGQPCISL